ncbi:MAG: hypothetical protein K6L80_03275 [Agarilytica sp.]
MATRRISAIVLAWLLMSQPVLSVALTNLAAHEDAGHDHSSAHHDHHGTHSGAHHEEHDGKVDHHEHKVVHQARQDAQHSLMKATPHDCGPCVNGDMSHCQCGVVVQPSDLTAFRNYAFSPYKLLYTHILAAYRESLFRPPIFA